ncbi:thioredoxin fold domain-containing protein [Hydrogenophaga laconesensis]|uniref:Thioredoxin-related protein n=1 Tax=Hydrogenophaga laconesensis TaxID=1805971 RepID=A0ABU1VIP5_9BURK|nr:thioredoxin fold domain-containing protein [Hydrogenophaga laconesensis]MDR7097364.1 thioredoxin-related protein [Hydrogenophaga laconesensis]
MSDLATTPSTPPAEQALPSPTSLRGAAQAAAARGEPLVVMTTLTGCPYCAIVRNHYLLPMRREGKVHAVQLDVMDRTGTVQSFDGQLTTPAEQARAWKARFTPTVLFFGPDGRELAERLVGIAVPDFYGEYLEARLTEARRRLK